ncbi:hypothetical protein ADL03_27040 [Nocardia sp. NRRL S-836]|nr:hypothetical protein ADL03_27040 [Nocardia sp. NRRL S-836]
MVQLGGRLDPLPDPVVAWLSGAGAVELTDDAATDLIEIEARLRGLAAQLAQEATSVERALAEQRRQLARLPRPRWAWRSARQRRRTDTILGATIKRHSELADLMKETQALQAVVRDYVISLDPPSGRLREVADGWKRSPEVPPTVVVMGTEDEFFAADSRRTRPDWGYPIADADLFGEQWRRDGDDHGPHAGPAEHSGSWQLGYIPRTGEIYASRRCGHLPQQVWLLGREFGARQAHTVLDGVLPRMREPNSLILAAGVVHAARSLRGTRHRAALRRPGAAGTQTRVPDAGEPDD